MQAGQSGNSTGPVAGRRRGRLGAPADLAAGLFFIALAALGLWALRNVRLGTSMRMGPAYVPTLMCYLLLLVGGILSVKAFLSAGAPLERWYLRPLGLVSGAALLFTLAIAPLGLFATIVLVVAVAALATAESRPAEVAAVALALAVFSTALFVYGLGLPLPAWPTGAGF